MKILIVGSGPTGGLIGARLIEQGKNPTFLVRAARKRQIMTTGLALQSQYGRFRRPASAIAPDEPRGVYDLVIFACRAHHYEAALDSVEMSIGPETMVLPLVEGPDQLQADLIPHGARLIGGRLEARIDIDADGVLTQRSPRTELRLGACDPRDSDRAILLAGLLAGRGIDTALSPRIGDEIWERFCFLGACVAVNASTGVSLRDAVPPTHRITPFDRLLAEGATVGRAIGLNPRFEEVSRYRTAYRIETRPVQPPALLTDGGARTDESVYLLCEMVQIAERAKVPVPRLKTARDRRSSGEPGLRISVRQRSRRADHGHDSIPAPLHGIGSGYRRYPPLYPGPWLRSVSDEEFIRRYEDEARWMRAKCLPTFGASEVGHLWRCCALSAAGPRTGGVTEVWSRVSSSAKPAFMCMNTGSTKKAMLHIILCFPRLLSASNRP